MPSRFEAAIKAGATSLLVLEDPLTYSIRRQICELAAKSRLPTIYGYKEFVEAGGLMSYGTDRRQLYRRAAEYVDKILKGAKPGNLPVEHGRLTPSSASRSRMATGSPSPVPAGLHAGGDQGRRGQAAADCPFADCHITALQRTQKGQQRIAVGRTQFPEAAGCVLCFPAMAKDSFLGGIRTSVVHEAISAR
jgi:hypothetical protein